MPPVWITGAQGIQAGRDRFIFAPRGLGVMQQPETRPSLVEARAQPVFGMAGIAPEGIDVLGLYDSFSPLPLFLFEDFGFCAPGDGLDWIQDGRIALGGEIPTNTNGGQLSHAQVNGWGQVRELVLQLRGQAAGRQVPDATAAMWASVCGDAMIFQRG
jgi:acetyl-CoA acetyltransferase